MRYISIFIFVFMMTGCWKPGPLITQPTLNIFQDDIEVVEGEPKAPPGTVVYSKKYMGYLIISPNGWTRIHDDNVFIHIMPYEKKPVYECDCVSKAMVLCSGMNLLTKEKIGCKVETLKKEIRWTTQTGKYFIELRPENKKAFIVGLREDGVLVWKYLDKEE